jgi:fructokinase
MFGSISMAMEPIATTIEKLILKESANKVIAFDPNIRPFMIKDRGAYLKRFEKLAAVSTIAKVSLEDFSYIEPKAQPDEALEKLSAMGARLAIITLGPDGAIAKLRRDDGSTVKAVIGGESVPNLVDTVGAGDTFHGALLAWLETKGKMSRQAIINLNERELYDALVFACKAAAFVCGKKGAEPPYPRDLTFSF